MKRFREIEEQHREKGRFRPTIPRNVPNTPNASPRDVNDSANVRLRENLDILKDAPSILSIAKKHNVSVAKIKQQLKIGKKVEAEHGKNPGTEKEIALDHINEKPDYYTKLKKYVESHGGESDSIAARTYDEKPQKEPMKTYKQLKKESVQQLDELSPATKASYKEKAQKTIKELQPHAKSGEYKDIAQNIINRRQAGLAKMKEESEITEGGNKQVKGGDPCWKGYQMVGMKNKGGRKVPNCVPEEVDHLDELSNELLHRYKEKAAADSAKADKEGDYKRGDKRFSGVIKATNKQFDKRKTMSMEEVEQIDELKKSTLASYADKAVSHAGRLKDAAASMNASMKGISSHSVKKSAKADKRIEGAQKAISRLAKEETEKDKAPFEPTKTKKSVIPGKYGAGYSTARHLARQAMQKQVEKMKKVPIKEESKKAAIVKGILKSKKKDEGDKFQKDPELSSQVQKIDPIAT